MKLTLIALYMICSGVFSAYSMQNVPSEAELQELRASFMFYLTRQGSEASLNPCPSRECLTTSPAEELTPTIAEDYDFQPIIFQNTQNGSL